MESRCSDVKGAGFALDLCSRKTERKTHSLLVVHAGQQGRTKRVGVTHDCKPVSSKDAPSSGLSHNCCRFPGSPICSLPNGGFEDLHGPLSKERAPIYGRLHVEHLPRRSTGEAPWGLLPDITPFSPSRPNKVARAAHSMLDP